jgi:hypothetical protein
MGQFIHRAQTPQYGHLTRTCHIVVVLRLELDAQCFIHVLAQSASFASSVAPVTMMQYHGPTRFQHGSRAKLTIRFCNHRARIFDWTFKDYEWAFGNLGFGFHNWPINETLAMELGKVLEHRVKIAYQHY